MKLYSIFTWLWNNKNQHGKPPTMKPSTCSTICMDLKENREHFLPKSAHNPVFTALQLQITYHILDRKNHKELKNLHLPATTITPIHPKTRSETNSRHHFAATYTIENLTTSHNHQTKVTRKKKTLNNKWKPKNHHCPYSYESQFLPRYTPSQEIALITEQYYRERREQGSLAKKAREHHTRGRRRSGPKESSRRRRRRLRRRRSGGPAASRGSANKTAEMAEP